MTAVQAGVLDDLDTDLTAAEKADIAATISPLGTIIGILQYIAGAIVVLGIIAAGFTYFKGDPESKSRAMGKLSAVIVGSILVFGAITIARTLNLVG